MSFLTIRETAAVIRCSYEHTRKLVNCGQIPSTRFGKRRRVAVSDVESLGQRQQPRRLLVR